LLTLLLFTESCSRPSFLFFLFLAVCNLVFKLRNKTTSRKRPLLEARFHSSSWRNIRRGRVFIYLNMDAFNFFRFFLFGFYFLSWKPSWDSLDTRREREPAAHVYDTSIHICV
jgi:hypothetical protein